MSTFSQQPGYLTQSQIDTITIGSSADTIDFSSINLSSGLSASDTITITGLTSSPVYSIGAVGTSGISTIGGAGGYATISTTSGTATISTFDISNLESIMNSEWKHHFPDWSRVQKMCEVYPGLKIAFEKFKTTYYLVKDDYDNPNTKK